ncbi:MAG: VOC family protein [Chloroflexi bacterium]|nr:MAG: VOC family protein [Chloroflexota bacterium]
MLRDSQAVTTMVTTNRERTKRFYGDVLGLRLVMDLPDGSGLVYEAGKGSRVMLYMREKPSSSDATSIGFVVDDVRTTVRDLRSRGVTFEEYDMPGIKTVDGIATMGQEQAAWFKDPDGNIIGVFNGPI